MVRALHLAVALLLALAAACAAADNRRFSVVVFHDVVDREEDLDGDAVTTARLVEFFDWVRAGGWTPISLDDVAAAARGARPLPERALLVTFDDAYRSVYTRVYPLALAYRIPVVVAVVGSWVDAPMDATVRYGDRDVSRRNFIAWSEAREMARSGLVEFASHSFDLHRGVTGNPQGDQLPAAAARVYSPGTGYETEVQYRTRIRTDLARSRTQLARELGRPPRALVWPYGRYSGAALEEARAAGFEFVFTLDPEPGDAARPLAIGRYYPTGNPTLGAIADKLRFDNLLAPAQRFVCVDPAALWSADPVEADARLGRAIERVRALGATAIALDPFVRGPDRQIEAAWFQTGVLPVRADYLSWLAWKFETRAGASAYLRLPIVAVDAATGGAARTAALLQDLGAHVPFSGALIEEGTSDLAAFRSGGDGAPPTVRRTREAIDPRHLSPADRRALETFRLLEQVRPALRLALFADEVAPRASGAAELTFLRSALAPDDVRRAVDRLSAAGALAPDRARRIGLWLDGTTPPEAAALSATVRAYQVRGGTAIGWCPDDPAGDVPAAAIVGPSVSAATFPLRP